MKKRLVWTVALCVGIGLVCGNAFSERMTAQTVEIQVAPQTLLLGSVQGGEVTVHVDIPLSAVERSTIEMNGVLVSWTKADVCGDLVAKFDEEAIKAIVGPPSATLTLVGTTLDGEEFSGSDTVRVKP